MSEDLSAKFLPTRHPSSSGKYSLMVTKRKRKSNLSAFFGGGDGVGEEGISRQLPQIFFSWSSLGQHKHKHGLVLINNVPCARKKCCHTLQHCVTQKNGSQIKQQNS
jgi:hypothetical protein